MLYSPEKDEKEDRDSEDEDPNVPEPKEEEKEEINVVKKTTVKWYVEKEKCRVERYDKTREYHSLLEHIELYG